MTSPQRPAGPEAPRGSSGEGAAAEPSVAAGAESAGIPAVPAGWLQAYQDLQQQVASAHGTYQRLMAESHLAFLRTAETTALALQSLVTGRAVLPPAAPPTSPAPTRSFMPEVMPVPPGAAHQPPPPAPLAQAVQAPAPAPGPMSEDAGHAALAALAPAAPFPREGEVDFRALLLGVVAEKTGYPEEILEMEMSLESDLGIDSIKRVEILSALQERAPWLPEVDAAQIPDLQTLGQVLALLESYQAEEVQVTAEDVLEETPVADLELEMSRGMATAGVEAAETGIELELRGHEERQAVPAPAPMEGPAEGLIDIELERPAEAPMAPQAAPAAAPVVDLVEEEGDDAPGGGEGQGGPGEAVPDASRMAAGDGAEGGELLELVVPERQPAEPPAGIEGAPEPVAQAPGESELLRLAVQAVPAPASGRSMLGRIGGGLIAVTDEGTGVGRVLVGKLRQRGFTVELTDSVPRDAHGVIFTGGLRPVIDIEAAIAVNREAFQIAHHVASQMSNNGGVFVTVQATGGDFGLSGQSGIRAWLGGLAGLARTASKEWERAAVKAIDVERGSRSSGEVAQALFNELTAGGPEMEVGLHDDGSRTALRDLPVSLPPGAPHLDERSVLVVTGGARGVTGACVLELARRHRPRILLLGRTELAEEPEVCRAALDDTALKKALLQQARASGHMFKPAELGRQAAAILANREIKTLMARVARTGAEAVYQPVDIRDGAALRLVLGQARERWGSITGLIHGAGVLSDKRILDKSMDQFDRVFDTKVEGLRLLLEATDRDHLELLCLFSSIAARHGNTGQADYAMANEVLNQVAMAEAARRRGSCLVRSIIWGPWQGGMVTPSLAVHFQKMGIPLISLEAGARFLAEELRGDPAGSVQVLAGARGDGE